MKATVSNTPKVVKPGYPRLVKGQSSGDVFILFDDGTSALRISGAFCSGLSFKVTSMKFEPFDGAITLSNE